MLCGWCGVDVGVVWGVVVYVWWVWCVVCGGGV
jgi:hypothetical protein